MSDLRKYINLVDSQLDINERRLRIPGAVSATAPKIGATAVNPKDGLTYQWMGRQWVQKAGQAGGKGRVATKKVAAKLTASQLKSRGNLLTRIVKKNPKISAALAAIVGIKVGGGLAGDGQPQVSTPPSQSGQPAASTTPTVVSPATTGGDADLAAIKAEIDALIAELSASESPDIKKELDRIKNKLNPKPARLADNPSIIE